MLGRERKEAVFAGGDAGGYYEDLRRGRRGGRRDEPDIKDGEFRGLCWAWGAESHGVAHDRWRDGDNGRQVFIGDDLVNGVPPRERDVAMVFQNYALYTTHEGPGEHGHSPEARQAGQKGNLA